MTQKGLQDLHGFSAQLGLVELTFFSNLAYHTGPLQLSHCDNCNRVLHEVNA